MYVYIWECWGTKIFKYVCKSELTQHWSSKHNFFLSVDWKSFLFSCKFNLEAYTCFCREFYRIIQNKQILAPSVVTPRLNYQVFLPPTKSPTYFAIKNIWRTFKTLHNCSKVCEKCFRSTQCNFWFLLQFFWLLGTDEFYKTSFLGLQEVGSTFYNV